MRKDQLQHPPALSDALPVLCANCRQSGRMGEGAFDYLGELLSFTPVPRRPHVNGWDAERQRGFIAALAVTGSPSRAARAIGKHAFGAEQLRTAPGGQSFSAAWAAALDIARERELHHFSHGLAALAEQEQQRLESFGLAPTPGTDDERARDDEARDAHLRIRLRFVNARRHFLAVIAPDRKKRRAWEALVGPTDWTRAARLEPQPGEPDEEDFARQGAVEDGMPRAGDPDIVLAAANGYLAELTGGADARQPLRDLMAAFGKATAKLTEEEQQAVARWAEQFRACGWKQHLDGSWYKPTAPQPPRLPHPHLTKPSTPATRTRKGATRRKGRKS